MPLGIAGAFLALAAAAAPGALRLPAVVSDHVVLQAGTPDAIWGWAERGEEVSVTFTTGDGKTQNFHATTAENGRWSGTLPALAAGTAGQLEVRTDKGESKKVDDVLVGEVWLCGGQSNMSYLVQSTSRAPNESTTPQLLAAAKGEATAAAGTLRYFQTRFHNVETTGGRGRQMDRRHAGNGRRMLRPVVELRRRAA